MVRSAANVDKSNALEVTVRFPATPILATNVLVPEPDIVRCPYTCELFKTATGIDFRSLFLVPFSMAVAAALILLLFFHPPQKNPAGVVRH